MELAHWPPAIAWHQSFRRLCFEVLLASKMKSKEGAGEKPPQRFREDEQKKETGMIESLVCLYSVNSIRNRRRWQCAERSEQLAICGRFSQ